MRALAATSVVAEHVFYLARKLNAAVPELPFGRGVDVFFVISGFVMVYANRDLPPGEFAKRRLIRIVPLYWITTTLAVLWFLPGAADIVSSYLFIPIDSHPVHTIGWTLNYEMLFYALFAASLFLPRARVAILTVVLIGMALLHLLPLPYPLAFWTDPVILEFAAGMWLAIAYRPRPSWPLFIAGTVIAMALFGLAYLDLPRFISGGVPAVLLVASMSFLPNQHRMPGWIMLFGAASYSIYLTHGFTVHLQELFWPGGGALLFIVVGLGASLAIAVACHLLLERPIHRWLLRRFAKTATAA